MAAEANNITFFIIMETEHTKSIRISTAHLRNNDIAVRCPACLYKLIQDVLRNLSGLSTASGATNDDHWVIVNGGHDLLLKVFYWQLTSLHEHL